jgi:hypothetical protein
VWKRIYAEGNVLVGKTIQRINIVITRLTTTITIALAIAIVGTLEGIILLVTIDVLLCLDIAIAINSIRERLVEIVLVSLILVKSLHKVIKFLKDGLIRSRDGIVLNSVISNGSLRLNLLLNDSLRSLLGNANLVKNNEAIVNAIILAEDMVTSIAEGHMPTIGIDCLTLPSIIAIKVGILHTETKLEILKVKVLRHRLHNIGEVFDIERRVALDEIGHILEALNLDIALCSVTAGNAIVKKDALLLESLHRIAIKADKLTRIHCCFIFPYFKLYFKF